MASTGMVHVPLRRPKTGMLSSLGGRRFTRFTGKRKTWDSDSVGITIEIFSSHEFGKIEGLVPEKAGIQIFGSFNVIKDL